MIIFTVTLSIENEIVEENTQTCSSMMSSSKSIRAPPFEPVLASQRWIKQKYNSNADGPVEITMTPIIQRRLHIKQPETCRRFETISCPSIVFGERRL